MKLIEKIKQKKPILKTVLLVAVILVPLFFIDTFLEEYSDSTGSLKLVDKTNQLLILFTIGWLFVSLVTYLFNSSKKITQKPTIKVLKNITLLIGYVIIFLYVLQTLGIDVSNLLAVGGVAGLAIGLASKDILANLISGLILFLDRPFSEGEWIYSSDREIEGTVKSIGLRMTLVETFDKRPLYIPNSTFSNILIENPSRMRFRRIKEVFSIRYKDFKQVEKIVSEVESYLRNHPAITTTEIIMVSLTKLSSSSIDSEIYCFTKTTDWKTYRTVKQEVMLNVMKIIQKNKAEIPFPTRTLDLPNNMILKGETKQQLEP